MTPDPPRELSSEALAARPPSEEYRRVVEHVDVYLIHWAMQRLAFQRRDYRPEARDWWQHGHSYAVYTKPHDDGQCGAFQPDPPAEDWTVAS